MKTVIFLKTLLLVVKRIAGVTGFILCYSIPAYADTPKVSNKPNPSSNLILTLTNQWLTEEKTHPSINSNIAARHNNETQASALERMPVNVDCDMDVIQNTVGDIPLSNRLFGGCDLHYRY